MIIKSNEFEDHECFTIATDSSTVDTLSENIKNEADFENVTLESNDGIEGTPVILYNCSVCKRVFKIEENFEKHKKNCKIFKCSRCNYRHTNRQTVVKHQQIHKKKKKYVCPICQTAFQTQSYMKLHLKLHTLDKPFKCLHCDKAFKTNSYLKRHLVVHSKERPFQCTFCHKNYKREVELKRHYTKIHKNETVVIQD